MKNGKNIVEQSLMDVEKIKEAAEKAAQNKIIEEMSPHIKNVISKAINEQEDVSDVSKEDEEELSLDDLVSQEPEEKEEEGVPVKDIEDVESASEEFELEEKPLGPEEESEEEALVTFETKPDGTIAAVLDIDAAKEAIEDKISSVEIAGSDEPGVKVSDEIQDALGDEKSEEEEEEVEIDIEEARQMLNLLIGEQSRKEDEDIDAPRDEGFAEPEEDELVTIIDTDEKPMGYGKTEPQYFEIDEQKLFEKEECESRDEEGEYIELVDDKPVKRERRYKEARKREPVFEISEEDDEEDEKLILDMDDFDEPSVPESKYKQVTKKVAELKSLTKRLNDKLRESNLLNTKLLFTNKLLLRNDLTYEQIKSVINSFDESSSLKEAKLVYNSALKLVEQNSAGKKKPRKQNSRKSSMFFGGSSKPSRSAYITESRDMSEANEDEMYYERWQVLANLK